MGGLESFSRFRLLGGHVGLYLEDSTCHLLYQDSGILVLPLVEKAIVAKAFVGSWQKDVEKLFEAESPIEVSVKLDDDLAANVFISAFHRVVKHELLKVCGSD